MPWTHYNTNFRIDTSKYASICNISGTTSVNTRRSDRYEGSRYRMHIVPSIVMSHVSGCSNFRSVLLGNIDADTVKKKYTNIPVYTKL
jgi:hypothetical protein